VVLAACHAQFPSGHKEPGTFFSMLCCAVLSCPVLLVVRLFVGNFIAFVWQQAI
jgi:hypothetical protein